MSVLIKGMTMPKNCNTCLLSCSRSLVYIGKGEERNANCPMVEVSPHGRLIDADELYEKTAEWEAQALHMVEKTMNDEDKTEWHRWSEVLTERSAFKYDIADAPTIIGAEEGEDDERVD